jgi:uncharacterized membrane protein YphA (DoxX/SURF4 family)
MRNENPFPQTSPSFEQLWAQASRQLNWISHRHGPLVLRVSIGVVFLWFGVLKFFPAVSPAEELALRTLTTLTFELVPARALLIGLAIFESAIGVCFVTGFGRRFALPLLVAHMLGTGLPFLMFPGQLFQGSMFVPTFLGQYIVKNIIIVSAALVLQRRWR